VTDKKQLDPWAAPPSLFRLSGTICGWRAGAPSQIWLAAARNISGGGEFG